VHLTTSVLALSCALGSAEVRTGTTACESSPLGPPPGGRWSRYLVLRPCVPAWRRVTHPAEINFSRAETTLRRDQPVPSARVSCDGQAHPSSRLAYVDKTKATSRAVGGSPESRSARW
jgi:hypothetical protein